jgi:hypothetical protein
MKNIQTDKKNSHVYRFLTNGINCTIVLIAFSLFVAGVYPTPENWGIHFLAFYPPLIRFGIPLLMLLLVNSSVRQFMIERLENLAGIVSSQNKTIRFFHSSLILVLSGVLFWIGRTETHFLGDGYLCLRSMLAVANNEDLFSSLREPFVGFLLLQVNKIFSSAGLINSVELAYRTMSVASGTLCVFLVWLLTKYISTKRVERILVLLFLFASGTSQLFFGYVENYTPAYLGIILFSLVSLQYLHRTIPIIFPFIVFSFLIVINFGMGIFLPVFLPLIRESVRRKETRAAIVASLTGLILVPILLWISDTPPEMLLRAFGKGEGHLVPLFHNPSIYYSYTLFSLGHATDLFNLFFLIQPMAFVMIIAGGWFWRGQEKVSGAKLFFLLMMVSGAAFITLLNCELGMSRDWDLMAPFAAVFSIAAVYGWFQEIQESTIRRNLFGAMTAVALLQTGLWIGINANETRAIQRLDILQENPYWSTHAKYDLAEERAIFHRDRNEYFKEAMFYERAVTLQPSHIRLLTNLADAYIMIGDTSKVIQVYERIEALGQATAGIHDNLGILYFQSQQYEKALNHWYAAEALDSISATIPYSIGATLATYKNSYTKALPYFLKVIKRDSLYTQAYYGVARCFEEMGDKNTARLYYSRYAELNQWQR